MRYFAGMLAILWMAAQPTFAQLGLEASDADSKRFQIGAIISADHGPAANVRAAIPTPMDWPEQTVKLIEEDITPGVRRGYQTIDNAAKQLMVHIPRLGQGETARVVVTFEVTRHPQDPPEETADLRAPQGKEITRELRKYLAPSPLVESDHDLIGLLLPEITLDKSTDWEKVEAIYDWVRETVKYENGPFKGAIAALHDRSGDCEELTSLIIAFCRGLGVPARTVWVPGHCYPEFYLVDGDGKGKWYPCQAAGTRAFGGIVENRPILQKGENFRVPMRGREPIRYLAEYLSANGVPPTVNWLRPGATALESVPLTESQRTAADATGE